MLYTSSASAIQTLDPLIITSERLKNRFPSFSLSPVVAVVTEKAPLSPTELQSQSRLRIQLEALEPESARTAMTKEELPHTASVTASHDPRLRTLEAPALTKMTHRIPHYWTDVVGDNDDNDDIEDNVWRAAKARQQQQLQSVIDMLIMFAGRVLMWWFLSAETHMQETE